MPSARWTPIKQFLGGTLMISPGNGQRPAPPAPPAPPATPARPVYPLGQRELDEVSTRKAGDISRCADILRQKYKLDRECMRSDPKDKELQARSEAIYNEIYRRVYQWTWGGQHTWMEDEWRLLQEICEIVGVQRY